MSTPYTKWLINESTNYDKNRLMKNDDFVKLDHWNKNLTIFSPLWQQQKKTIKGGYMWRFKLRETAIFITQSRMPIYMRLQNTNNVWPLVLEPGVTIFQMENTMLLHTWGAGCANFYPYFCRYFKQYPECGFIGHWTKWEYSENPDTFTTFLTIKKTAVLPLTMLARKACINQKEINRYSRIIPFCAERTIQITDGDLKEKCNIVSNFIPSSVVSVPLWDFFLP